MVKLKFFIFQEQELKMSIIILRFIYFDLVTRHYTSGQYSNILEMPKSKKKISSG